VREYQETAMKTKTNVKAGQDSRGGTIYVSGG
jgi:hypothetical protein